MGFRTPGQVDSGSYLGRIEDNVTGQNEGTQYAQVMGEGNKTNHLKVTLCATSMKSNRQSEGDTRGHGQYAEYY